jgi:UDP-glucuronate 4-epimerase
VSPYAATKLAGEQMIHVYSRLFELKAVCLRLFTVYGPRQRPDLAIHKFYRLLQAGRAIPLYGDGATGRDYTFVGDIVRGVLAAIDLDTAYEIINLGGGHPILLRELVQTLGAALGVQPQTIELPAQPGDAPITFADTSKAARLLGFAPSVSFEQGIRLFHQWYQSSGAGRAVAAEPIQPAERALHAGSRSN